MKTKKVKAKRKISHRIKANVSGWDLREYKKVKKEESRLRKAIQEDVYNVW